MWPLWSTQQCLRTQMVLSFTCLFILIKLLFLAVKHSLLDNDQFLFSFFNFFFQVKTLLVGPKSWSPVISSYCVQMVPVLKSPSLLIVTWLRCQLRLLWFTQMSMFLLYMDYWTEPRYYNPFIFGGSIYGLAQSRDKENRTMLPYPASWHSALLGVWQRN